MALPDQSLPLSVLNYETAALFLEGLYQQKKSANPKFSLRAFSQKLSIKSSGTVSLILRNKRKIPKSLIQAPFLTKDMTPAEVCYWQILASTEKKLPKKFVDQLRIILKSSNQNFKLRIEWPKQREDLGGWLLLYLYNLPSLKDKKTDLESILAGLPNDLREEAQSIIFEMVEVGALVVKKGRLSNVDRNIVVSFMGADKRIANYHKMILRHAEKALDRYDVSERWFASTSLTVAKDKIPELFREIEDFHRRVLSLSQDSDADEIVQFSSQCFPFDCQKVE